MKNILLILAVTMTACYCWQPEHANEAKCVIAHQEINCATDDVKSILPGFLPIIEALFNGQLPNVDKNQVIASLEVGGFKFVGCSLAQLENDFITKPGASSNSGLKASSDFYHVWKSKKARGVCFLVTNSSGKAVCR